jgi:hypothetical protein
MPQTQPYERGLLAEEYATCSYATAQFHRQAQWYSLRTERRRLPPPDL